MDQVENHKFYDFGTHRTQLQTLLKASMKAFAKGKQHSFCKQPLQLLFFALLRAHHDAGPVVSWKPKRFEC